MSEEITQEEESLITLMWFNLRTAKIERQRPGYSFTAELCEILAADYFIQLYKLQGGHKYDHLVLVER